MPALNGSMRGEAHGHGGLRICMFTTFYPPYNFGGDGIGVQRLARAFVSRGHRVRVVHDVDAYQLISHGRLPEPAPEADGVEVVRLRTGHRFLAPLLTQQFGYPVVHHARIRELLDRYAPHVIFFHNVSLVGGPGLLEYGRAIKLYEAHEHWLVCPMHVLWRYGRERCDARRCIRCTLAYRRPPQPWRLTHFLERRLHHVDAFIAKSRFSRDKHRSLGFPREMDVIPYFLPEAEGDGEQHTVAAGASSQHAHGRRPYFLFVGRLERLKGLDDVIPAMAALPEADLLIAGDGEHEQALRRAAAGIDNVRFLGRVGQDELAGHYRHARALLVPGVGYETFGIILIEAFRQGTPVIARRLGPFPEIVEAAGGGLLFATTEEMVEAMRRMLTDPAGRERMARAAREGFRRTWTEEAVMPRYLDLIAREARRRGRKDTLEALEREVAA